MQADINEILRLAGDVHRSLAYRRPFRLLAHELADRLRRLPWGERAIDFAARAEDNIAKKAFVVPWHEREAVAIARKLRRDLHAWLGELA